MMAFLGVLTSASCTSGGRELWNGSDERRSPDRSRRGPGRDPVRRRRRDPGEVLRYRPGRQAVQLCPLLFSLSYFLRPFFLFLLFVSHRVLPLLPVPFLLLFLALPSSFFFFSP